MPTIRFTQNIQRHVICPEMNLPEKTLQDLLEAYFAIIPEARGYVFNDQGVLRKHMALFIDGQLMQNRDALQFPLKAESTVDVMQALSGG